MSAPISNAAAPQPVRTEDGRTPLMGGKPVYLRKQGSTPDRVAETAGLGKRDNDFLRWLLLTIVKKDLNDIGVYILEHFHFFERGCVYKPEDGLTEDALVLKLTCVCARISSAFRHPTGNLSGNLSGNVSGNISSDTHPGHLTYSQQLT